jgi:hypothetical protein
MRLKSDYVATDFEVFALVDREDGFARGTAYVGHHPQARGALLRTETCPPFEIEWRSSTGGNTEALVYRVHAAVGRGVAAHVMPDANLMDGERRRVFEMIRAGTGQRCRANPNDGTAAVPPLPP